MEQAMQINLVSEAMPGDGPEIEICEYSAQHDRVSWDERSPLVADLAAVVQTARRHAEKRSGAAMVLEQLSLDCIGPIKGTRYYFFTTHFQHEDGAGEPIMLVSDLRGKLAKSKTL